MNDELREVLLKFGFLAEHLGDGETTYVKYLSLNGDKTSTPIMIFECRDSIDIHSESPCELTVFPHHGCHDFESLYHANFKAENLEFEIGWAFDKIIKKI